MGNFLSDLDKSKEAVNLIMNYLSKLDLDVQEASKKEQHLGDIFVTEKSGDVFTVEVKYDIMAQRTGNLCFEMSNGSKNTGIMTTQADFVYYVVPGKGKKVIFVFKTEKLREFITLPENVIIKNGGDKRKFVLALVKMSDVVDKSLAETVFSIEE